MEICEKGEVYREDGDDFVFDHTKLILRGCDGEFYYAKTEYRLLQALKIPIDVLQMSSIAVDVWPLADPTYTLAPDPLPSTAYIKRPQLLYYNKNTSPLEYTGHILAEVEACELLSKHPHPNIARYLGCIVKDGRIRGLAFTRYARSLSEMLKDGLSIDTDRCIRGVEAGIRHMHELGLIHNDLNPMNIMMEGEEPVIIDFDSCKPVGEKLGSKTGTDGWALEGQEHASRENDFYGLSKLRAVLIEKASGC